MDANTNLLVTDIRKVQATVKYWQDKGNLVAESLWKLRLDILCDDLRKHRDKRARFGNLKMGRVAGECQRSVDYIDSVLKGVGYMVEVQ